MPAPPHDLNVATRTSTAKNWIAKSFLNMRHNPPNADNPVTQISRLSPQSLHKEYERWCDGAREHPIDENCFRGIFYTTKAQLQIVMRTSKQGSTQCWLCSLFGEFKKTAVGFAEKAWVEDLKTKHALFHAEETRLYEQDAFEGKDPGGHTLSINADGAASHAHTIPKVAGRVPKSMPEWHQKLQGLVVHGHALNQCEKRRTYVSNCADADLSAFRQRPVSHSKAAHRCRVRGLECRPTCSCGLAI